MEKVFIGHSEGGYPDKHSMYSPDKRYPEYRYTDISRDKNGVYETVRCMFCNMKLDYKNYGMPTWNPLGEFISSGQTVLIKPNWVMHKNLNEQVYDGGVDCLVTHPSIVRAVIDYVLIALDGKGKVIIGDAPLPGCDLDTLFDEIGYKNLRQYYEDANENVEFVDFRDMNIGTTDKGYIVDLKTRSRFNDIKVADFDKLRITSYNPSELKKHHCKGKHEYYISKYTTEADVIINMPKPKTHRKAGMTGALKNMIGANAKKEYLPHHKMGSVIQGGDEYKYFNIFKIGKSLYEDKRNSAENLENFQKKYQWILKIIRRLQSISQKDSFSEGSWYGNDTIWRTILDVNYIVRHITKEGILSDFEQRTVLSIGDMIVAGEGEGPLMPTPKNIGLIIGSFNATNFDIVVCKIMGFDYRKIPTIVNSLNTIEEPEFDVIFNNQKQTMDEISYDFEPASGWRILKKREK